MELTYKRLVALRFLMENTVVMLFQFCGLMLTTLTINPQPMSFAAGSAAAFIFMRGNSILPGIGLGSFFSYYLADAGIEQALIAASVYMGLAWLLLVLSYRFISVTMVFQQFTRWCQFALLVALLSAVATYFLLMPFQAWLSAWLACINGILIFGTAIVTWDYYFPEWQALRQQRLALSCLYVLLVVSVIAFIVWPNAWFAVMPLIISSCISRLYGWCGAIAGLFVAGILMSFAAMLGVTISQLAMVFLLLQSILAMYLVQHKTL